MDDDKFLTTDEVVEYFKIPKSTIYKLTERDGLPGCKIGKQLRFRKSSLDKWLSSQEQEYTQKPTSKNLLLIDDDPLVLKTISKFLRLQGYNVEPVQSMSLLRL